jgi:hypothetical protein
LPASKNQHRKRQSSPSRRVTPFPCNLDRARLVEPARRITNATARLHLPGSARRLGRLRRGRSSPIRRAHWRAYGIFRTRLRSKTLGGRLRAETSGVGLERGHRSANRISLASRQPAGSPARLCRRDRSFESGRDPGQQRADFGIHVGLSWGWPQSRKPVPMSFEGSAGRSKREPFRLFLRM